MLNSALDYPRLDEAGLTALAQGGDPGAFRTIMTRCNQRLFRLARAIVGNDADAEDVLQEAYLKGFRAISGFRGEAGLFTWLAAITLNEARGRLRRRKRHAGLEADNDADNVIMFAMAANIGGTPEDEAARAQMRRLLERAVDDLPLDFRLVFLLREVEGCSVEEAAAQLGIKPATVKTRHHRARQMLKAELEKKLSGCMADAFAFLGARCAAITARVMHALDVSGHIRPEAAAKT